MGLSGARERSGIFKKRSILFASASSLSLSDSFNFNSSGDSILISLAISFQISKMRQIFPAQLKTHGIVLVADYPCVSFGRFAASKPTSAFLSSPSRSAILQSQIINGIKLRSVCSASFFADHARAIRAGHLLLYQVCL